jgi:hypothetical protein
MNALEAERTLRELWRLLVSAHHSPMQVDEAIEVERLSSHLATGVPGWERFNRAAKYLLRDVAALNLPDTASDAIQIGGLLAEVDHLRSLCCIIVVPPEANAPTP